MYLFTFPYMASPFTPQPYPTVTVEATRLHDAKIRAHEVLGTTTMRPLPSSGEEPREVSFTLLDPTIVPKEAVL